MIHSLNRGFAVSNPYVKYAMIKLKPGFHMIATIAVIAAIAENKKLQRLQRS